jgi:hypothetical protein
MLKKTFVLTLIALLLQLVFVVSGTASSESEKDAALAQKVRAYVMGLGKEARVRVKLKDDSTIDGYISEIGRDSFIVRDAKSGSTTTVTYSQARQVKRNQLSTGAKIGIGVAAAVGVGIIIAVAGGRSNNSNANEPRCVQAAVVGKDCPPGCICALQ